MTKKASVFLFLSLIFVLCAITAEATVSSPSSSQSLKFLGQDQSYSVTFRGNGEAVVSAKIIFSNLEEASASAISLRVPRVNPQDIIAYQAVRESRCLRYKAPEQDKETKTYINPRLICEEYQEPDYFQYWYGQTKYQRAKFELKGDTIIINLPKEIKPESSGSLIVYYRAVGYAKKNIFGAYNFTFETLKVEDKIRNLKVGISTDADLYLRGTKGKVNYRFNEGIAALKSTQDVGETMNPQIDNFYQQIGYGSINKSASDLQPLDSYTVKGSYADSILRLYAKEILIVIIVALFFILLFVLLARFLINRLKNKLTQVKQTRQEQTALSAKTNEALLITLVISFIASILIFGYTLCLFFISSFVNSNYYLGELGLVFVIFFLIISFAVYGLLLLGPALFLGIKKGIWWGVGGFILIIVWLVLYLIITFVIISIFRYRPSPIRPVPLKSTIEKSTQ